jgi:hypothetical protein
MISLRTALASFLCITFLSLTGMAQDFARYRDFQFGMSVESVAKQIQMKTSDAKTSQQRPATIQTIQWDSARYFGLADKDASIRSLRFDFYNDELSKIAVTYDPVGTAGLTTDDFIEALSAIYGTATKPEDFVTVSNHVTYEEKQKVLARWEDPQYSYNLFRSSYGGGFGVVAFSKRLDLLSSASSREADRLDKLEAPAKERARQNKQEADERTAQEAARSLNKPKFRP